MNDQDNFSVPHESLPHDTSRMQSSSSSYFCKPLTWRSWLQIFIVPVVGLWVLSNSVSSSSNFLSFSTIMLYLTSLLPLYVLGLALLRYYAGKSMPFADPNNLISRMFLCGIFGSIIASILELVATSLISLIMFHGVISEVNSNSIQPTNPGNARWLQQRVKQDVDLRQLVLYKSWNHFMLREKLFFPIIGDVLSSCISSHKESDPSGLTQIVESALKSMSWVSLVLLSFLLAFFGAALIEEWTKWLFGRRWKSYKVPEPSGDNDVNHMNLEGSSSSSSASASASITIDIPTSPASDDTYRLIDDDRMPHQNQMAQKHNTVSNFVSASLGFAGVEHLFYGINVTMHLETSFWKALFDVILRALVAFPLHCGTGFLLGISVATHEPSLMSSLSLNVDHQVQQQQVRLSWYSLPRRIVDVAGRFFNLFAWPLLFHGAFDFVAFFCAFMVAREELKKSSSSETSTSNPSTAPANMLNNQNVPWFVEFLVTAFDFLMVTLLALLVTRKYAALIMYENTFEGYEPLDTEGHEGHMEMDQP